MNIVTDLNKKKLGTKINFFFHKLEKKMYKFEKYKERVILAFESQHLPIPCIFKQKCKLFQKVAPSNLRSAFLINDVLSKDFFN